MLKLSTWGEIAAILAFAFLLAYCSVQAEAISTRGAFERYAAGLEETHDLAPGSLRAILAVESNWNPNARGAHGEIGLGQIKPATLLKICPECVGTVLVYGAVGPNVARVQAALSRLKLYASNIDGVWGPQTQTAVLKFQAGSGLAADGVVGPKTWLALFGEALPSADLETQLLDPWKNMQYAARYLSWLRNRLGTDDTMILAAAYNAGDAGASVRYMMKAQRAGLKYREGA